MIFLFLIFRVRKDEENSKQINHECNFRIARVIMWLRANRTMSLTTFFHDERKITLEVLFFSSLYFFLLLFLLFFFSHKITFEWKQHVRCKNNAKSKEKQWNFNFEKNGASSRVWLTINCSLRCNSRLIALFEGAPNKKNNPSCD